MERCLGENNRKFLEIIRAHSIRLNNIASDLLVLSDLESGRPAPERWTGCHGPAQGLLSATTASWSVETPTTFMWEPAAAAAASFAWSLGTMKMVAPTRSAPTTF